MTETSTITVRKHKGRSGRSVFEWRVYREGCLNGAKAYRMQLAKFRTKEKAESAAEFYRANDAKQAALTGWDRLYPTQYPVI